MKYSDETQSRESQLASLRGSSLRGPRFHSHSNLRGIRLRLLENMMHCALFYRTFLIIHVVVVSATEEIDFVETILLKLALN